MDDTTPLQNEDGSSSKKSRDEKIKKTQDLVNQVKKDLLETVRKLLQREEELSVLIEKGENLAKSAVQLKQKSHNVERKMCWKNLKTSLVVGLIGIIVFILVIYLLSR